LIPDTDIVTDQGDPGERLLDLTQDMGADVVIEAGGTPESLTISTLESG